MPSKRQLDQLKSAKAASVQSFKRKKIEASQILTEPESDDKHNTIGDEPDTADTTDTESQSETWYWNKSGVENDTDPEEDEYYNGKKLDEEAEQNDRKPKEARPTEEEQKEEGNTDTVQPGADGLKAIESTVPSSAPTSLGLKYTKKGEDQLRGFYGNGSRATTHRRKNEAREREKQALNTYNLKALWQRGTELGILSKPCTGKESDESVESLPSYNLVSPPNSSLSQVPRGHAPLLLEQHSRETQ